MNRKNGTMRMKMCNGTSRSSGMGTPPVSTSAPSLPLSSPEIELPCDGRIFSDFADEVGEALAAAIGDRIVKNRIPKSAAGTDEDTLKKIRNKYLANADASDLEQCFLCIHNGVFGRIQRQPDIGRLGAGVYFQPIDHQMAVTELERWVTFVKVVKHGNIPCSLKPPTSKTLISSPEFLKHFPRVDRIFEYSLPIKWIRRYTTKAAANGSTNGTHPSSETAAEGDKLVEIDDAYVEPAIPGVKMKARLVKMEPGFGEYVQANGEHIYYYCDKSFDELMTLQEATDLITFLLSEFPLDDQSKINAIARLLTPRCQGLMGWKKRSPLWVFTANKPRSGKDYLAMLTPLIHSHYPNQDPPLEYDEEVKRRITAALLSGRRFMHFANCRKNLDNPSLEAAVTAEYWTDRIIRTSAEATVPNEIIFSLSYNDSLPMTRDIAARMRVIRLHNKLEEGNLAEFKIRNLHERVTRLKPIEDPMDKSAVPLCRLNILAALDTFIRTWVDEGCPPPPPPPMASYPEWTRVVGGIMASAKLGNPCIPEKTLISATFDDWKTELLALAKLVCDSQAGMKEEDKEDFETCDLTTKFIKPNPAQLPMFNQKIKKLKEPAFNSELGQYIHKNIGQPLATEDALYFISRDGNRNSTFIWRFKKVETKRAQGSAASSNELNTPADPATETKEQAATSAENNTPAAATAEQLPPANTVALENGETPTQYDPNLFVTI
jgi:hypothetical protein